MRPFVIGDDLLLRLERYSSGGPTASLVLPRGCDVDATVDLLVRDAIGCREVDVLLLDRRIRELRRLLEPLTARGHLTSDPRTGEPEREVPPEGVGYRFELTQLEAQRERLEAEIASLRGPEGLQRARAALARYGRLVASEQLDETLRDPTGEVVVLSAASYGLEDTMQERLQLRAWTLGLAEDHEEARLTQDELARRASEE